MPQEFKKAYQTVDPAGHGIPTEGLNDRAMGQRAAGIAGTTSSTTDQPGPLDDRTHEDKYSDSQAAAQVNKGGNNFEPTLQQQRDIEAMNERLSG